MKSLFSVLPILLVAFASCKTTLTKDEKTKVAVENADRHYYPILQGEPLEIYYRFTNTGTAPLIIDEIQSSCGCVVADKTSYRTIRPGNTGSIKLSYNSNKNIGFVKHYVQVYGNVKPRGKFEISFDLHVVPDPAYLHDYEELYARELKEKGSSKGLLKEEENQNRYYVDSFRRVQ